MNHSGGRLGLLTHSATEAGNRDLNHSGGRLGLLTHSVTQAGNRDLNHSGGRLGLLTHSATEVGQQENKPQTHHGLFRDCLTSQQHARVHQGRFCSYNRMCCHTDIEEADQTCYLTQSQYTDTGSTSPGSDPITPGAWQGASF